MNVCHYYHRYVAVVTLRVTCSVSTSSSDYFKCCCLPSLQITFSSPFFTGKVKQALNSHVFLSTFAFVFTLCSVLFPLAGDDEGSCFSFLRFIDVSPAEMSNLMMQGTLVRWASDPCQQCWRGYALVDPALWKFDH